MLKHVQSAFALALLLAGGLPLRAASADSALALHRERGLLVVKTRRYEATIDADSGGRVVSFAFDGEETTGVTPDGRCGLLDEVHSSDFPFQTVEQQWEDGQLSLALACEAGGLYIRKRYVFRADRPWFLVEFTFENRTPFALSGREAPAFRNLVLPADGSATGRELYCLNRGLGSEALATEFFISQVNEAPSGRALGTSPGSGGLRWIAVCEPTSRRSVGFVLRHAGARVLPPERVAGGSTVGWSYAGIPPGHRLSTALMVVPLRGFAGLSELNEHFAADSLPDPAGDRFGVCINLTPLTSGLEEVSVITRAYDGEGKETAPCDPLLFENLEPSEQRTDVTRGAARAARPAWLFHEVYSKGDLLGRFAVPVDGAQTAFPPRKATMKPPTLEPVADMMPPTPEDLIPLTPSRRERGFLLWAFSGVPPQSEVEDLAFTLTANEKRTVFLGVRALRHIEALRVMLTGVAPDQPGPAALPPAAVDLWQVRQDGDEPARLVPVTAIEVDASQTVWLAVTADASALQPGPYAGRLAISSGGGVLEVPLAVEVLERPAAPPEDFGLWYMSRADQDALPGGAVAKLGGYGVSGLTLTSTGARGVRGDIEQSGFQFLAFWAGGGTLAPGPFPAGRTALPYSYPLWVLRVESAAPATSAVTVQRGYVPALLCQQLAHLPAPPPGRGQRRHLFVDEGCEEGAVAGMVESGVLSGDETVWLHLDLHGADWRRAALQVRSAFWAGAWQGLAGAAVSCPPPDQGVDRQLVIWHVLRDARQEVALWRTVRREAGLLRQAHRARDPLPAAVLLTLGKLEQVVGPADHCMLGLEAQQRPFRELLRVAPGPGQRGLSLAQFSDARQTVLSVARQMGPVVPADPDKMLYWQDIPLLEDGGTRWTIVASEGEDVWKKGIRLQEEVRQRSGLTVPVQRSFPDLTGEGAPLLVWVIAGPGDPANLPEPCRVVLAREGDRPVVVSELETGTVVVILRGDRYMETVLRGFRASRHPYATARQVR